MLIVSLANRELSTSESDFEGRLMLSVIGVESLEWAKHDKNPLRF